jgi:DNA-binding transcriptional regulator YbjK
MATSSGVRVTSQDRSSVRRRKIATAAIATISKYGLAGVTHRLVAKEANVSLAATTYYYRTKADIIADASSELLDGYVAGLESFAERIESRRQMPLRDLAIELAVNAAGPRHMEAIAWFEIMLGAARQEELRDLTIPSLASMGRAWARICRAAGLPDNEETIRSAMDIVIGLTLAVTALGADDTKVAAVLRGEATMADQWAPASTEDTTKPATAPTLRAQQTRDRIVTAAIELLVADGPASVTLRSVAEKAGLAPAAPTYHFPRLELLLAAAHEQMFGSSKSRYGSNASKIDYGALDTERLIDLTNTILIRETTEHGAANVASYTLWMEAARRPELRQAIWSFIDDQCRAWDRLLDRMGHKHDPLDSLVLNSLFIGKVIRLLGTGTATADLARARSELAPEIRATLKREHWMTLRG